MNKKIIIVNGPARNGKTTFINFLSEILNVKKFSTIDKYKKIAIKYYGWDGNENHKDEKTRALLSTLKLSAIDYANIPYYDTIKEVNSFLSDDIYDIICIDCRDIAEIEKLKEKYKSQLITICLLRNSVKHIVSNEGDKNVFNYTYDTYIENNGSLDELKESAKTFVNNLINDSE